MEGWESLRPADNEQLTQNKVAHDELDLMFVRCFSTEAGAEVLDYLKSMTLDQQIGRASCRERVYVLV